MAGFGIGEAIAVAGVLSSVASAGYGIENGMQQASYARAAADVQQRQYEDQRKAAQLDAEQREAANREELNRVLGAQTALRGARGLDPFGAPGSSGLALRDTSIQQADQDLNNIELGQMQRDRQIRSASTQAQVAGERQAMQGYAQAFQSGGQLLSSISTGYKAYKAATV